MIDHSKYMKAALAEAEAALTAGDFPVGCVLVFDNRVVIHSRRQNSRANQRNEMDHAEINGLRLLFNRHPELSPTGITVYSTMEPCLMCYTTMLLNGIRKFVYAFEDAMGGGTDLDLTALNPLYREMQVEITGGINRHESLELFRRYFSDPANDYWQDSLLARAVLQEP
ncbi:MAG: nucleoside deaminase [Proteobacteria bacterium]|nr:nucleoside deaminase [Pseudomonadota bacterium]MBU1686194.1 nucleoside deaminase [Pseudomonadota bacterium]